MKLRGITIDNGGSEVRVLPYGKNIEDGLIKVNNMFAKVKPENFRYKETVDPFSVIEILKAPHEQMLGIIVNGMTVEQYPSERLVISNQSNKTASNEYYMQFIFAVAQDAIQNKCEGGLDYVITTCIPVKEHSGIKDCSGLLKHNISGSYMIRFPLLPKDNNTVSFRINKENIFVVPEGAIATVALGNMLNENVNTLVIDVGHVTADLSLFKGKDMYGSIARSSNFAGMTIIALLKSALQAEGINVGDAECSEALMTGYVKKGINSVDVSRIVKDVKKVYVNNYLKKEISELLSLAGLTLSQIQYIVPVGAIMTANERVGSMIDEIINIVGFKDSEIMYVSANLRYVNIEMASKVTAKVMRKLESKNIGESGHGNTSEDRRRFQA